ncbi:MAG: hypothetical protein C0418_03620 [Coriobacteriaceae bacterium]|nr:hypothetical protein [Coriobacteriaceae bacterium]
MPGAVLGTHVASAPAEQGDPPPPPPLRGGKPPARHKTRRVPPRASFSFPPRHGAPLQSGSGSGSGSDSILGKGMRMSDALERLVNLAMYFASSTGTVTRHDVRAHVAGYPKEQDEGAFLRMFERDKDDLLAAGLVLNFEDVDGEPGYRLDRRRTYGAAVDLTAEEAATLRAVGTALVADPGYPWAEELRLALAKLMPEPVTGAAAGSAVADEDPNAQGARVAVLSTAADARKTVTFTYTTSADVTAERTVDPYGLFLRDGRWYLVGHDHERGAERTFTVSRMLDARANAAKPRSADFERPPGFDVGGYERLPFQYGTAPCEAVLRLTGEAARRAPALTGGAGVLERAADGSFIWRIQASGLQRLARWLVENGPGVELLGPAEAVALLRAGLQEVERTHG